MPTMTAQDCIEVLLARIRRHKQAGRVAQAAECAACLLAIRTAQKAKGAPTGSMPPPTAERTD